MKMFLALAVVAAAALATSAFAGDCGSGSGGACGSTASYDCSNQCPLAKQANTLRSSGQESFSVSPAMRASLAVSVQRNLAKI